jgi:DNA mismatch repair protein MutS
MFEQYQRIKADYLDALLFYRMGDFYELFFDDAKIAARELQITLTSRNPNVESPIPMCGVPWHAADGYISQLLAKGYRVAVCEQVEDPRDAKGLVERRVVRVDTAGTVVEDGSLESKAHSFLAAMIWSEENDVGGLAWVDVSTGYWSGIQSKKIGELWQWAQKLAPKELLVPDGFVASKTTPLTGTQLVRVPLRSHFDARRATERILAAQCVADLHSLGLESRSELLRACGALLAYLEQTQMQSPGHLSAFVPVDPSRYLIIDEITERNLEIFKTLDGRKGPGTLRHIIDHTMTPMGGRQLEDSLRAPWREPEQIFKVQQAVAWLKEHEAERKALRAALGEVYDLERLSTRISLNRAAPKDFLALRNSLEALPRIEIALGIPQNMYQAGDEEQFKHLPSTLYERMRDFDRLDDYADKLRKAFVDNPPAQITEGGLFKPGYNAGLDELFDLEEHGEATLNAMLDQERKASNLPRLKIGYNRIFGYFFELGRSAGNNVPDHFIRRQSLANAERFTTEALKALEEKILNATDRRKNLEYKLFNELRADVATARTRIKFMAVLAAQLDYWQSLAETAARLGWIKPELHEGVDITIAEGRHPVVESFIGAAHFVPNDARIDQARRILLITGPNMSGKSTILRQVALICILAQMGSFVPAASARIGLADRIFSRVGASDNLAGGQSTFMVEMMETARILRQATKRSLIILDEIGRGTSTYDGLAIAWAVVEDLARRANGGIRTLFATHYLELAALEGKLDGLHTMNVAIREYGGEIVFLRRLVPGPADRSYGIEVAKLAGVPQNVVQRAKELHAALTQGKGQTKFAPVSKQDLLPGLTLPATPPITPTPITKDAAPAHPLLIAVTDIDLNNITPIKAFNILSEWKLLWGTP